MARTYQIKKVKLSDNDLYLCADKVDNTTTFKNMSLSDKTLNGMTEAATDMQGLEQEEREDAQTLATKFTLDREYKANVIYSTSRSDLVLGTGHREILPVGPGNLPDDLVGDFEILDAGDQVIAYFSFGVADLSDCTTFDDVENTLTKDGYEEYYHKYKGIYVDNLNYATKYLFEPEPDPEDKVEILKRYNALAKMNWHYTTADGVDVANLDQEDRDNYAAILDEVLTLHLGVPGLGATWEQVSDFFNSAHCIHTVKQERNLIYIMYSLKWTEDEIDMWGEPEFWETLSTALFISMYGQYPKSSGESLAGKHWLCRRI